MPAWHRSIITLGMLTLALGACSSNEKEEEEAARAEQVPVEKMYAKAQFLLEEGKFRKAVEAFEEVEREHPFSEWARRAKLMAAYASYEKGDYADAVAMLEGYIRLHPASKDTPYAYYLIALSYYEQIADVGRDQANTERARQALRDVMRRFPESDYAADARLKLDLVEDHLAGKEMEIGRYYLKRGEYLPALNRFRRVIKDFDTTSHTAEALHRMTEGYLALGLTEDARRSAAVLGYNFPGSPWYQDSYTLLKGRGLEPQEGDAENKGWLGSIGDLF